MVETISQLFLNTVASYPKPDILLYKDKGRYVPISSEDFGRRVRHFALGLTSLGCRPGDKVIILSENCPEWVIADFANLCLGAITVPIYPTLVPEQVRYIIDDSDATIVICSTRDLWQKIEAVKNRLTKVRHFISLRTGTAPPDALNLNAAATPPPGAASLHAADAPPFALALPALLEKGRALDQADPALFEKAARAVKPADLASIIYTSGTTGVPKGVMLTHANFISNINTLASIIQFGHPDYVLSFLPLSHVLERMVTFAFLSKGCSIGYAESVETVADNLLEVRPNIMVSVPRLFEKLYSKVMDAVLAGSGLKRKIFHWALNVGRAYGHRKLLKQRIPRSLKFKRGLAHKLVFSKILEKTGGRVRFFVSGGAPLSKEIADFFYALGLTVLEGYGLTETAPVVAVNTFEDMKFGTVGKPIPGIEVKIAPDGEILVKGPNVMKGYYKKDEETREAFEGGWFRTGDIGHLDEDGFLVITDRKKDLIITAGGKNVAPQPIENVLKRNPYIANAVVVGGSRKFISAIIVPDLEKLQAYAKQNGISYVDTRELVAKKEINAFLLNEIDRSTPQLAPYEKIKKILVLDRDFAVELEEMTPTLKVRRGLVEEKFKDLIDSLYRE